MTLDPNHVKIARRIARSFTRRLPPNVTVDDLEQAALLGLVKGMLRHPHGSGPGFEWYLAKKIRGAVLDELRAQDYAPRRARVAGGTPVKVVRFDDLSARWGEDGSTMARQFATDEDSPEDEAIRRLDAAKAWRAPMKAGDYRVARACFAHGRMQRDMAESEGVTEPRISQRVARALQAMRQHMGARRTDRDE